jgi:pantoate--beta-alanine ligase
MVADLCLPVEVVGAPTVREPDGLALSSRNRYLEPEQRRQAVALSATLDAAAHAAPYGIDAVIGSARAELRRAHGVDLDYLEVTDPDLGPVPAQGPARVLIAARVGSTRLIDNRAIDLGRPPADRDRHHQGEH